jgi:hypothetical protein
MTTLALQIRQTHPLRISAHVVAACLAIAAEVRADEQFVSVPLQSRITHVQPMTGIVFWSTSQHTRTDAIQLEYSYMKANEAHFRGFRRLVLMSATRAGE